MRKLCWTTFLLAFVACVAAAAPSKSAQLWFYVSRNLWVDENVSDLEKLMRRASKSGYTHLLLSDSKFGKLGEMDSRYFRNINRVKAVARECSVKIIPAVFPIGYSNDLLWHDPNLIEALPVKDAVFMARDGHARLTPDSDVRLKGGDFSNIKEWDWNDSTVIAQDGAVLIRDPKGQNSRIVQKLSLKPFRQYHFSIRIKTEAFQGSPEVKVIAGDRVLNYDHLGVKPTQDWTLHHVVFNSLEHTNVNLYAGCWGGQSGSLWFDDAQLEEAGLVNLVRRPGAPLLVRSQSGELLVEGRDFEPVSDPRMGNKPWKGAYDVWHLPPSIKTSLKDGTALRVSYYHAATVHNGQAMICPSEPRTIELLRDQARRMHDAWGAEGYMMSHDEIRVFNWCAACQGRKLDAGALLADNVRTCARILREINPRGRIYTWSDMFDPNHNARNNYYLVRGNLAGSWEGLDRDIVVLPWYYEKRREQLRWFANRGHRQVIAGYYDQSPERIEDWLEAARSTESVEGVMYTTWEQDYSDLESFAGFVR